MALRHLQINMHLVSQPQHLAVRPVTLGSNLGRAELTVMFEHAGKKHWLVVDAIAHPLKCRGQLFKRQVGVGRYEIQIKGNVFHVLWFSRWRLAGGDAVDQTAPTAMRSLISCQSWR